MANKIQFRRGARKDLPALAIGEPGVTTDGNELFIGTSSGNIKVTHRTSTVVIAAADASGSFKRGADYICDGYMDEVEIKKNTQSGNRSGMDENRRGG